MFPEGACETSGQKCCGKTCVSRDAEFSDAECVPASGTEDPCREYGCHPVHGCISVLKPECRCDSDSDCKKFSGIDECVVGKCNTEDGTCDYSGRVECSEDPDDGNACTISECDPATGTCVPGKIDCGPADTGLPCALAACDPATGKCRSEEYPLCYDDPEITKLLAESKCLYPECDDSSGGCYVAALTCEYLDPCLEGACNPYTGRCTRNPVTCPADEKVAVPENSCLVTGCTFARDGCFSDIVVCDDRNECTNDFCTVNKISGEPECSVEPVNCDCDPDTERSNSDPCEWCWCSETSGCETEKVDCDDGNPATSDSCVPATGECVNVRKDCALGNDGDGNLCTESWLDPKTGICRPVDLTPPTEIELGKCILVTGPCDPSTGKFPTENKKCVDPANPCLTGTCDPETGECKNFLPRDCSPEDGNPCLDGTCDPLTGECDFVSVTCPPSVHGTCGISECRSCSGGCVDARKNCPEDGNFCTDDWCDSETLDGKCQSTPTAESRACSARSLPCLPYECDPLDGTCRAHPVTCDYDASGNLLPADECLLRYCDPAVGECVEKWICEPGECTDDGDCDDGNPCTEGFFRFFHFFSETQKRYLRRRNR